MKIFKTLINSLNNLKMSKLISNKTEEEFKGKHPISSNHLKISGPMTMTISMLDYDYTQKINSIFKNYSFFFVFFNIFTKTQAILGFA